ncbi:neutral cholesterol ester hydrolase 1-like [Corythoichthys intestinalis]|uniref:neutral cholesterol ester hydrolase 1-like n=1 Tax=Corythoichthys intestinalis TaxID=161448 RepID=UPI0025A51A3E|nr:neutral cholesterol ester hydrolase 1-like [Corythoichthys intestinalis]XP_061798898.1 neutral cholesterol ester hydrolase 1-like [Nerophis lumbriciformis]
MWLLSVAIAACLAVAVRYLLSPLPADIQQKWKLLLLDAFIKTLASLALVMEWLGLGNHIKITREMSRRLESNNKKSKAEAGEGVPAVNDTSFNGIPVRVYQPSPIDGKDHLKRGLLYIHGGGWAYGSPKVGAYNYGCRKMSKELHMVVVSVDYRLYPDVRFPMPYLDCLAAAKHFLSPEVLTDYGVDPRRVGVAGDSAGGNLSAAIAQAIATDDSMPVKFNMQALIYPALQALDFKTPSYQQNRDMVILDAPLMAQFWLQYLGGDLSLKPRLLANEHSAKLMPELRAHLDWTALLPPECQKGFFPAHGKGMESRKRIQDEIPNLLDVRASPLLAGSDVLAKCPQAYIMTCEYDVLRDDGLMYARRLKDAGVEVTSEHHMDGFHACFSLNMGPFTFDVGVRVFDAYLQWLRDNL